MSMLGGSDHKLRHLVLVSITWLQAGQWSRARYYKRAAIIAQIAQLHMYTLLCGHDRLMWLTLSQHSLSQQLPHCGDSLFVSCQQHSVHFDTAFHCPPGQVRPALEPPLPSHRSPVPPTRPNEACSPIIQHSIYAKQPAVADVAAHSAVGPAYSLWSIFYSKQGISLRHCVVDGHS